MGFINTEIVSILLFFIGLFGLVSRKSIMKAIVSIGILETAVVLFLLSLGFTKDAVVPIGLNLENAADPLPQALVITAIIIGVSVTAVNLTMFIALCRQYGSADWHTLLATSKKR